MKFAILATIIFCFCSFFTLAQSKFEIKGGVADSAENLKLSNTTVVVLNAKDSTLRAFTWTDKYGDFYIRNLTKGKFLIIIAYPGYADYVEDFALDSVNATHDFRKLNIVLKSRLLKDVIVKGQVAAIRIKGDTTEYNSRAYKIQPNDKVEDLLRQLPGIEVDKDGKITAQGQTVNKVLVDGEEFFGDDPTLVTQNIRGDMVDKIQLYDKKTDQAAFIGIEDGIKIKTINIKLKEDKKNGYFGKLDAEGGTDGYYQDQLLFNKFRNKEKLSTYATLGNTGKTGLNWQDDVQYGSGRGSWDDLESYNGFYDGKGIPLARSGGIHYDNKFNNFKASVNANYKVGSVQVDGNNSTLIQNNLPDSIISNTSNQKFNKYIFRQKLDITYEERLDTTSNLKIYIDGLSKHNTVNEDYFTSAYVNGDALLNINHRNIVNRSDQKIFNTNALYTKKFKKTGRTISVYVSESVNQNEAKGFLKSEVNIYTDTGKLLQITNQYKTNNIVNSAFNSNITYTEPISKSLNLVLNYSYNINAGSSDRRSYDSTGRNQYNSLDTEYSNDYQLRQHTNQVGAIFNYSKRQHVLNFGTRLENVNYEQTDQFAEVPFRRRFTSWQPQISYQYRLVQQGALKLSYNGNTMQPSIDQIQPLKNNTDPFNIITGNPYLKPSFKNNFNIAYNSYQIISEQAVFVNGSYSFTSNAIVSNTSTDGNGKTIYQVVNLPTKTPHNFNLNTIYSRRLKPSELGISFELSANGGTSYNKTNNILNTTNSNNYSGQLAFSQYKVKKYQFSVGFGPTYTINESSLQQNVNNNGKGFNTFGYFSVYLPFKLMITGNGNYQYIAKTQSFDRDFSKLLINTTLAKAFFTNESLKITLTGNDLLNQNIGFTRYVSGNMITQSSYTTIKRYIMLSVVWDFNKMGA